MIKPQDLMAERAARTASLMAQAEREIDDALRDHFDGEKANMDVPRIDSRVLDQVLDQYRRAGWHITQTTWRNETTLHFTAAKKD